MEIIDTYIGILYRIHIQGSDLTCRLPFPLCSGGPGDGPGGQAALRILDVSGGYARLHHYVQSSVHCKSLHAYPDVSMLVCTYVCMYIYVCIYIYCM